MKNLFFIVLLFFFSCSKDLKPEQVLRSYINERFSSSQNYVSLISKTTGELKEDLNSLKGEDKKKFDSVKNFKKNSFKVLSKSCNKSKCQITYIISFERDNKSNPYKAQIRNIANLELVAGNWKISSIDGLKSYFDNKKSIDP